ncbi:inosine monophosphate dehydrogenase [Cylindrobasidium torrendii FP15055 ss-10]|uniref:Inosine monophosphate dehydrogenase n=1 Tax=Cylindrobasidium torrendii FP15055 ss-10 TaxID=1314674 RepID=A0A0D7AS78_9AGAR|nr:inosine monophosphate dehydrogenase [Cylindrobasidium torrendii FP15055 ss-10]
MPSTISTRLTKLLGVEHPIVLAPMAFAANPALASAVTSAGAFGFIGAGLDDPNQLDAHLINVRKTLSIPEKDILPIGVGLITWFLEKEDERLAVILRHRVRALWFAFGQGAKVGTAVHVQRVRRDAPGTLIFVMVGSVEEAIEVAAEGVDVIVVQGGEAGGHGAAAAIPLSTLLLAVLAALPKDGPVIIAAGGIMTGAQVASVLALGAEGAVLGTRFILTPESGYSQEKKAIVANARVGSTVRGLAFDEMFGLTWPGTYNGRAIRNKIVSDAEEGLTLAERKTRMEEDTGFEREIVWAGAGAGLVSRIIPPKAIVEELVSDAIANLNEVAYSSA